MIERRRLELELIESRYGVLEAGPTFDWCIVKNWRLPIGWNKKESEVLILIPSGYPTTPPDNFYTAPDLRLESGQQPGNTSSAQHLGRQWLQFSYHVESGDWQPHPDIWQGHNLLTFLECVAKRLSEVS